ncbi:MAG: hypothetical protein U0905_20435 [Pirellulales bacterium]
MAKTCSHYSLALIVTMAFVGTSGCRVLHPVPIHGTSKLPYHLTSNEEPQIERGQPRPIIDGVGWVFGIPSKIVLWNWKAENHHISPETEAIMAEYLAVNDLEEVKVRLNQYRPIDDWRRLTRNTSVAWPWRYTFGAVSVLGETVLPGRVFGGDHYNPYTATVHLYSDLPSVGLHESAHAKDFSRRTYPGTYAFAYMIPGVPLWHERVATNDVLYYVDRQEDIRLKREAYHVLFPAYGTYVGGAFGNLVPVASTPLYVGSVVAGHVAGRMTAEEFSDVPQ